MNTRDTMLIVDWCCGTIWIHIIALTTMQYSSSKPLVHCIVLAQGILEPWRM